MKVKEESEKVCFKLNIQKIKITAPGPITSWGNNENSDRLYFLAPKSLLMVTASHEIKRFLLLGRKVMTNLDSILKAETLLSQQMSFSSKI